MHISPVIHWFRRDLRLTDNTALHRAVETGRPVIPVYIVSDWKGGHRWTGPARQQFLCESLEALAKNIAAVGGTLIFRRGDPVAEICRLAAEAGAQGVYVNRDPDPHGMLVEKKLAGRLAEMGVSYYGFQDVVLHERDQVLTGSGTPYRVFTPYGKTWGALPKPSPLPRVRHITSPEGIASQPVPTLESWELGPAPPHVIKGGERAARDRLRTFLDGALASYSSRRNLPSGLTTSLLSADLRHGTISVREIYHAVVARMTGARDAEARNSCSVFVNELAWREFYMQILFHYPEVLQQEFAPDFRGLPWSYDEGQFNRWRDGLTGFPIVDAGMRQLASSGFMHNRVRMITAMFLTKDLRIDWRMGEQYFMQALADGEIASNNGGWQWSAGTGADAAPYFRIQNPWTQAKSYDLEGEYIKKWVPELISVPPKLLHAPPTGGSLAPGYPAPMVDHSVEREKTLEFFKKARRATGKEE